MDDEDQRAAATLFLASMANEGIDPETLSAEQFSAARNLFFAGWQACAIWTAERAQRESVVL